jgi:hypothetical protein
VLHTCNPSYSGSRDQEDSSSKPPIVCDTLSQKNLSQKRADGVDQSVVPEFKPQYRKKNETC